MYMQETLPTAQKTSSLVILIGHHEHIRHLEDMLKEHVRKIAFIHPERVSGSSNQKTSFDLDAVNQIATENFKDGFEIVCCSGFPADVKALEHTMHIFEQVMIFSIETDSEAYARQMCLSSHDRKLLREELEVRDMQMSGFIGYLAREHRHRFDAVHHRRSLHVQAIHIANKIFVKMDRKLIPTS
jgi:hypothetical protein